MCVHAGIQALIVFSAQSCMHCSQLPPSQFWQAVRNAELDDDNTQYWNANAMWYWLHLYRSLNPDNSFVSFSPWPSWFLPRSNSNLPRTTERYNSYMGSCTKRDELWVTVTIQKGFLPTSHPQHRPKVGISHDTEVVGSYIIRSEAKFSTQLGELSSMSSATADKPLTEIVKSKQVVIRAMNKAMILPIWTRRVYHTENMKESGREKGTGEDTRHEKKCMSVQGAYDWIASKHLRRCGCTACGLRVWDKISSNSSFDKK